MKYLVACCAAFGLLAGISTSDPPVDPRVRYERVIAVVPMVGAGTAADPRRPMYAPLPPAPGQPPGRNGIAAFSYVISDDGKLALVEFVARDRASILTVLNDPSLAGKVFEKGKAKRTDIEHELKKYKKDFDLDKFHSAVLE